MIKKFHQFINEEVSGTELVGNVAMGPGYGDVSLRNNTISKKHTTLMSSKNSKNPNSTNPLLDDIFSPDDYDGTLNDYISAGGRIENLTDDKSQNFDIMVDFLRTNNS